MSWGLKSSQPAKPRFLEAHDLAVSKLAAGRPKDQEFVSALLQNGMLDVRVILARVGMLPDETDPSVGLEIKAWLDAYGRGGNPHRP